MAEATKTAAQTEVFKKPSQMKDVWRRLKKEKLAMFGLIVISTIIILAICAPLFSDYNTVIKMNPKLRLKPPSADHWFGTDSYGRDIFARCLYGARMSLAIGVFSAAIATAGGALLGAFTGYVGGRIDNIIMRFFDIISDIPSTVMALAVVSALGSGALKLGCAMAFTATGPFVRIVRATVLGITNQEYIEACRAGGTSTWRILTKHILPNAIGPIIVQATMDISTMIRNIATLSFLGLGVAAPTPEWGSMLSDGRNFIRGYPYITLYPGLAIMITVLALNMFGDGLRDAMDPKLRR